MFQVPNPDKSIFSKFASKLEGPKVNYLTTKDYEEQLTKLKKENFNLKLRIHFLEEGQGLTSRSPEDKEYVYNVNIDLKVENAELQNEVNEKKNDINEAYLAIDQLEKEKEALRAELAIAKNELSFAKKELVSQQHPTTPDEFEDAGRPSLLEEAFGSMNLGLPLENPNAVMEELKEKVDQLEGDLIIEKDHSADLRKMVETREEQIETMRQAILDKDNQMLTIQEGNDDLVVTKEEKIRVLETEVQNQRDLLSQLQSQLHDQNQDAEGWSLKCLDMKQKIQFFEAQNQALKGQLDHDQKASQEMHSRHDSEVFELSEALAQAQKALEEEISNGKDQQVNFKFFPHEMRNK